MRAEIVGMRGKIVGRTKIERGQTEIKIDHDRLGAGIRWRVKTFWGSTLASGPCRTIPGDTVVINLRGLTLP